MTPEQFIARWKDNKLSERAGAQAHFDDLCELLEVDKPRDPDNYCFERGAKKAGGGDGWADVWKRGHFGWENKKPGRDLEKALKQLTDYALQLENPPLLVVCDRERIVIHTAFTGYPDEPREIRIEQLATPEARQLLRWVFTEPEKLRPEKSTAAITAAAAGQFAGLAKAMRQRGEDGQRVAHFLVQCLFCMFAEDESLLPAGIFTDLLKNAGQDAEKARRRIAKLFQAMQQKNGEYGDADIPWFNGGLFKSIDIPPLEPSDLAGLHAAAADMDWRAIDPTIFGTLFERGLDPAARAPLGAHYTDTGTIEKLIRPLISEPLLAEWAAVKAEIAAKPKKAKAAYQTFLLRLNHFRVLDPACGSGNFLYLALKALRDVEKRAHVEAQELGLPAELSMQTGPHNILGLEINEFAAELARVTVWIGDIQWCRRNGYAHATNPILKPLDGIVHQDALIDFTPTTDWNSVDAEGNHIHGPMGIGVEREWPAADVVVGNPPFLGDKVMRAELGDAYVEVLRGCYAGRVPGGADLVTYWFEKARAQIEAGKLKAAGLVATNSIRGGANRKVLDRICETTRIFEAWSDEEWVNEGAAVRVSLVGFGQIHPFDPEISLDGESVGVIHSDLTAAIGSDLTKAVSLSENAETAFIGIQKTGKFEVDGDLARQWLKLPSNPNGRLNSDVVKPWANGIEIARRPTDMWIIDFGVRIEEGDACLYEAPFQHLSEYVKPFREGAKRDVQRKYWWHFGEVRPGLRRNLIGLPRFLVTVAHAKHRLFVWRQVTCCPDHALVVIARADDLTFGILHSRFHELWSLRLGTSLEDRPRYTPTTTFETFPFPAGMTPRDTAPQAGQGSPPCLAGEVAAERIAAAARRLNERREAWLNPPEWVDWVITPEEEKAGFPKRPVAKPGHEADLKKRTLTNLYNARPAWLDLAHRELDAAVAAAYGWTDYTPEMAEEEILRRLLALNLERAAAAA
ncbi:class I SAM-dependent DNA methyltransferase [Azospira sp.]|uniref:class I SAM-dependent DNA methyltransferase n=1 Tax=Azospira sp. TaxID=1872671 RepID=UPI0025615052|nr:DNA methyltransferase [Azospira sp.]MDK9689596.1 class I SAM-dependent DNA methyltransferase [Azospira sp.]